MFQYLGHLLLLKLGDAMQTAGEQLPEAASAQNPSRAAACATARLSEIVGLSLERGLVLLGHSILS